MTIIGYRLFNLLELYYLDEEDKSMPFTVELPGTVAKD